MFPHAPQHRRHSGFSLVEIMVGMIIGLLGIIVIMQMYSVFETQKRSTTSGADAQNSGAIALHRLQRDIQHSGYGISVVDLLGCNVLLRTGVTLNAIAPVTINHASIPAGDANTDTLLVVYGNSDSSPLGDEINAGSLTVYTMTHTPSPLLNDRVIAEPKSLIQAIPGAVITPRPNSPSTCSLNLDTVATANDPAASPPNNNITMTIGGVSDGTLYNLGQAPRVLAYAIRSGNLTACDYMVDNCGDATNVSDTTKVNKVWVPIASDIVSMRAQYGRDTATSATPPATQTSYIVSNTYDLTTPTTNCAYLRAPAVRIALVARGVVQGKKVTTGTPAWPTWSGSAGAPLQLSANLTDTPWQLYHYKVFETTVPLRNVTWMGVQAGC